MGKRLAVAVEEGTWDYCNQFAEAIKLQYQYQSINIQPMSVPAEDGSQRWSVEVRYWELDDTQD